MISLVFRIALIVCSILTTVFMIKDKKFETSDRTCYFLAHVCISSDCNKFVSTTYDLGC